MMGRMQGGGGTASFIDMHASVSSHDGFQVLSEMYIIDLRCLRVDACFSLLHSLSTRDKY